MTGRNNPLTDSPVVERLHAVAAHEGVRDNSGDQVPRWRISCVGLVRGRSDHRAVTSSWTLQESQVESYEHQDNSYIHDQPFPEPASEEQDIHSNYNGCNQHDVRYE